MRINLDSVPGAFRDADGLPRPQWDAIDAEIEKHFARVNRAAAYESAIHQWLERLGGALGEAYWLLSSTDSMLFSGLDETEADGLLLHAEAVSNQTRKLAAVHDAAAHPPIVVLILENLDTYGMYTSHFSAEEGVFEPGGCCIRSGVPHVVTVRSRPVAMASVVGHMVVHARLAHAALPAWLEEGVAVAFTRAAPTYLDHERAEWLRAYWRERGIERFWSGRAFREAASALDACSQLAEIIIRNMQADHRSQFMAFLKSAHWRDCGEQAARECFGESLADCAAKFLGPGDWSPPPVDS